MKLPGRSRTLPILFTTLLMAGVGAVLLPQSAQAAMSDCPSGYLCFWVDGPYGNPMGKVVGDNLDWSAFTQKSCPTWTWNDCASSVYDNNPDYGGQAYTLFVNNWSGPSKTIHYGDAWAYMPDTDAPTVMNMNDQISSDLSLYGP